MSERVITGFDAYPRCGELVEYVETLLRPVPTADAMSGVSFPGGRVLVDSGRHGKFIAVLENDESTSIKTIDVHSGQPGQGASDSYLSLKLAPSIDKLGAFSAVWSKCTWQPPHFDGGMSIENTTLQPGQFERYSAFWSATTEEPKNTLLHGGRNNRWESERAAEEALALLRADSVRALGSEQSTEILTLLAAFPMHQKLFWKMVQGSVRRDMAYESTQNQVDRRSAGVFTRFLGKLGSKHH